ncbi:MAG: uroporphyrinogen-III C-methyltransferase [Bacterioplanes sp.]|nr:uroporphyrinogen-III C-methyltransferase [Bacterioplanes sp.]
MTDESSSTDETVSRSDEPQGLPETKHRSQETTNASNDQPRARRGVMAWLLSLVMIVAAALAGAWFWQQQQIALSQQQQHSHDLQQQVQDLYDQLAQQQQAQQHVQQQLSLTQQQQFSDWQARLDRMAQQLQNQSERLSAVTGAERQDWQLAEAEYLLRLANQRLQYEHDVRSALSLLQAADAIVLETRNPRFDSVRALLAEEMLRLTQLPHVDTLGALHRIQALQNQLRSLNWSLPNTLKQAPPVIHDDVTDSAPWYQILLRNMQAVVSSMIRIQRHDETFQAPLSQEQQYQLQQTLFLMLEQAQVALLRKNDVLFQHSLARVTQWLDAYLLIEDDNSRAIRHSLSELSNWTVTQETPDISASLQQLRRLQEQARQRPVRALEEPAA